MHLKYIFIKIIDLISQPKSFIVKMQGGIADFYIKFNKKWFHQLEIDTVIDIGANIGQFSKTMRFLIPNAKIIAFEPLTECYSKMMSLMKKDINFYAFNIGLSNTNEIKIIQKSSYAPSSSFLIMSQKHKDAFPQTAGSKEEKVEVKKLDDIAESLELGNKILIKVDVQGYEDMVLKGGLKTFKKAKVLIMELSYQELYEKQPLFDDIYQQLQVIGFKFIGTSAQMEDPYDQMNLDADCIFINTQH